jgi:hypothetical protein
VQQPEKKGHTLHSGFRRRSGLPISKPKTKAMGIGEAVANVQSKDEPVDSVDHFKYLGSEAESGG